jgi:hypothetical protein
VAVRNGIVFMAGAATFGAGYVDNGTSADGGLFIGQYAEYLDEGGIPPTASITNPAAGAVLPERSLLVLSADAKDDVQVDSVDFMVNGQRVFTAYAPPYQLRYTVPVGVSSLTITAVARDTAGNATTSEPVMVTVTPNPAPVAKLLAPGTGRNAVAGSLITLAASASSQRGVSRVDFLANGTVIATVTASPYQALYRVPAGISQWTVTAIAYDDFGGSAPDSATLTVVPDQPPVAVFLTPRDGDPVVEGSQVQVLAGISDDVGISQATVVIEGGDLPLSRTGPPWIWWTPAPVRGATKRLELRVLDTAGHFKSSTITITGIADPLTSLHGTVLDPDGQPVAGAQVVEDRSGTAASSGADGQFLITGVPTVSGVLSVTASASLGGAHLQVQSATFTPVPGGQVELGQLVLAPAATTVVGVVVDAASRPVPGAGVAIVSSGPQFFRGTTDAAGRFRVSGVPQNEINTFVASATQGLFTFRDSFILFLTPADGDVVDLGLVGLVPLESPTTVQGTIVDTANQPVPGALVKVYNEKVFATTTSAADGSFSIPGLPSTDGAGFFISARITLDGDPFYGWTEVDAVPGAVSDAGAIPIDVFSLGSDLPTTVEGQLATLSGQPVGGARIIVMTAYDAYSGAAADGRYAISGIPSNEGPIQIAATSVLDGGYLTVVAQNPAEPGAGGTTSIEPLFFDDLYQIRGKVAKRPRKLGRHARLPALGTTTGAVCVIASP